MSMEHHHFNDMSTYARKTIQGFKHFIFALAQGIT